MLSNIGVAGCFAFAIFISRLFNDIKRAPWIVWAFWAFLLNMVIDIPDVTFPTLWVVIMLALSLQVCGRAKVSYQVKKNLPSLLRRRAKVLRERKAKLTHEAPDHRPALD
jgi:hypothetical protein